MKLCIEIEAPPTGHRRHGMLVYDETGENLEGFVDYGLAGHQELYRFYPRGTVTVLASLKVTGKEWRNAMANRILRPGETIQR